MISIAPLRAEDVDAVARLHAAELRYSFNSQLGAAHLAEIYRALLGSPGSYVGVAWDGNIPAGVVSGTLDTNMLKQAVLGSLGFGGKLRMAGRLMLRPTAVFALIEELKSRPPVRIGKREVKACLTAIAVASSHRRMGLAAKLTNALEDFFRANGVSDYWLETISENSSARAFYVKQGLTEVLTHGQVVVFVKQLR
jgi:ribosomal protein S18 acetylase RimI-like enzyme